jgi:hypothetical protein
LIGEVGIGEEEIFPGGFPHPGSDGVALPFVRGELDDFESAARGEEGSPRHLRCAVRAAIADDDHLGTRMVTLEVRTPAADRMADAFLLLIGRNDQGSGAGLPWMEV